MMEVCLGFIQVHFNDGYLYENVNKIVIDENVYVNKRVFNQKVNYRDMEISLLIAQEVEAGN
jgi:hypothetical protein